MVSKALNSVDVGKILRTIRKKRGLSQDKLGQRVSLSRSSISRIERGERALKSKELKKFLKDAAIDKTDYHSYVNSIQVIKSAAENSSIDHNESTTIQCDSQSNIIKLLKEYFNDKPLKKAYLFGSTARDEHTTVSDIDLYVSFLDEFKVTIFDVGRIRTELNELTGKKVDIVVAGSEYDFIKESLNEDRILIYG